MEQVGTSFISLTVVHRFMMSLLLLAMTLFSLLSIQLSLVTGKCHYVPNLGGRLAASCDVVSLEDYEAISSLDPGTTELVCNIPGILNDSLANFGHLRQLRTLQFLSPAKYTSYEMAALHGAQSSIKRVDIFENLTNLEELRINIVLIGFNWKAIRYMPKIRVLDVSHTQISMVYMGYLFSAIQKYKPPLQNLTMIGAQRVDVVHGTVPLEMGDGVYTYLRNIPLKILDLMDNDGISLQPGVSVHLPQLEILRIGANRMMTIGDFSDPLLTVSVLIDMLLHPSVREYIFNLPTFPFSLQRAKRSFDGLFPYEDAPDISYNNCTVQNRLDGNFLCNIMNCLLRDFVTFPCGLFQSWRLEDIFTQEKECLFGIRFPVPRRLQTITYIGGAMISSDRIGSICVNPANKLTHFAFANTGIEGFVLDGLGLKGFKKVKYLNIQGIGMNITDKTSLVADMPSLEMLLLGYNPISLQFPEKLDFLNCSTLRSLDMQGCSLKDIPPNSFVSTHSLEYLNISGNNLRAFDVNITALRSLKHLNLSKNLLQNVSKDLRLSLDKLTERHAVTLDLSLNPLKCYCHDIAFVGWLKSTNVKFARSSLTVCYLQLHGNVSNQDIDVEQFHRTCIHFDVIMSSIFSSVGAALVIGVGLLIYKRRWRLRYWMHVAKEALRKKQANASNAYYHRLENDFVYDAFVAYSSHGEERSWVHTTLREKLEGEHGLKLCMYHRDFKVGRDLADTIVEGINSSSKILLILSPTFLNSCWCEFEVRMANEKVVKERRDAVILVVHSRLDQAGVRLPRKLAKLLEKRIYIEWTEDPDGQKLFWGRLAQAMKADERHDAFAEMCELPGTH